MNHDQKTMQALKHSNAQLVHRLTQQDSDAFSELYDRHAGAVLGMLLKVVSNRARAEQLLEETFFALWQSPHTVNGALRPWLFRQACQQCLVAGIAFTEIRQLLNVNPVLT